MKIWSSWCASIPKHLRYLWLRSQNSSVHFDVCNKPTGESYLYSSHSQQSCYFHFSQGITKTISNKMAADTTSLRKKNRDHFRVSIDISTVGDIFIPLRSIAIFFFFSSAVETSLIRHLPYKQKVLSIWNFILFFFVSKFVYHLLICILTTIIHSWNIKKNVLAWLSKEEQLISLRSDSYLNIEMVPWPSFCLVIRMQLHFCDHVTYNISVQEV